MAGNSAEPGRSVASKITSILQAFANGGVHSLTEMAHLTGLPISTVHRLTTELAVGGVLERTEDGRYRVGLPLQVIGSSAHQAPTSYEWARPAMEDLATAVRADVRFGILVDLEVALVETAISHHTIPMFCGTPRLPAHATAMGKALLAFSPPDVVDQVIAAGLTRYTAYTLTSPDRLRSSLAETRSTCLALSRWELAVGLAAVAAPVFGAGGMVVGALEVKVRDPRSELKLVRPPLLVAARSLSRELAMNQTTTRVANGWNQPIGGRPLNRAAASVGPAPVARVRTHV